MGLSDACYEPQVHSLSIFCGRVPGQKGTSSLGPQSLNLKTVELRLYWLKVSNGSFLTRILTCCYLRFQAPADLYPLMTPIKMKLQDGSGLKARVCCGFPHYRPAKILPSL